MKKFFLTLIILTIPCVAIKAQLPKNVKAEIEIQAIGTTPGTVPFWMRSNQFGSIPLSGASGSILLKYTKNYEVQSQTDIIYGRKKLVDFGYGFEGRGNGGKNSNLQVIEAYAKVRAWIFQLKAGRTKDVMGLTSDTLLSSGNFSVSGNALGIPKIDLSIPDYYSLPIIDGLFSIKGNFAHGWIGKLNILKLEIVNDKSSYNYTDYFASTYLHQKSLYVRLAKQDWKLKLYGGFNHQVYWDDQKVAYGNSYNLSPIQTFLYVVTGKAYGVSDVIPRSKIGNQIGSIDFAATYEFEQTKISMYRQNIYDVGALAKLANIRDGLNGISLENTEYDNTDKKNNWKKILLELFYTKDQAGYPWSIPTASGDEDYYNNYYYRSGWNYKKNGLGNPLITRAIDARDGQAHDSFDYFINNRVIAWHLGFLGKLNEWDVKIKISYSDNYGTFATSPYGKSTGESNTTSFMLFKKVEQFSMFYETGRTFFDNYYGGLSLAYDNGRLLNNSFGLMLKLKKEFN